MREASGNRLVGIVCLSVLMVLSVPPGTDAQSTAPVQNVVYAELLGNALYGGSLNYERMLAPQFSVRVGASPFGAFPLMLNYLPGRGHHSAEAGLGLLVSGSDENVLGTATLGYRYQPRNGGMVFRAGWTPLFAAAGVATWAGASVGFAF